MGEYKGSLIIIILIILQEHCRFVGIILHIMDLLFIFEPWIDVKYSKLAACYCTPLKGRWGSLLNFLAC